MNDVTKSFSSDKALLKENWEYNIADAYINMNYNAIKNLATPENDGEGANKKYVDDVTKSFSSNKGLLKENGEYNIADAYINMNYNAIKNLATPENDGEGANKKYVDDVTKAVKSNIKDEFLHLIAAHASYHGDLTKGHYQFTFGGSSVKSWEKHDVFNGFLMLDRIRPVLNKLF